ncbi:MAG: glycosyl transferase family 1 [Planctomycetes bacterium RBG_13_63_9]|nr:MAG: glycosyl transferase family 1 [Planctomycetes bacterium RBG_13_63_9]
MLHTRVVTGTGGGPEKTILGSPRLLIPYGYHALCAYMHPPGDPGFDELRRKAESLGAPLTGIKDRGPWDLRVVKRMLDVCRRERVAIWHGHDYKSNAIGLLLRRFWPMKLVSTVHGWVKVTRRTPIYYRVDRFCLRHYDRVICVSDDLHQRCLRSGVPTDRCIVVGNAIDVRRYARQTPTDQAKRRLGLDSQRLVIGAVGRLSDEKNFNGLIRAVDRLLDDGLDVELIIVGEGDQKAELQRLISDLGRQDQIHLLGYRPDMNDLYQAMDVFVLSSLREGLPNVLLEAMAMEVPVVATRVAGVPQLVGHETNGLLVEAGDLGQLAESLKRLLMDRDLRDRLAAAARRTVEEHYSFEARMEKIRAIYDQLLGSHNGTADAIS